jgi:hypothetical protein
MHNQHAGLSQVLADQHITGRRQQGAHARLAGGTRPPIRRRRLRAPRWEQQTVAGGSRPAGPLAKHRRAARQTPRSVS